jgi:cardiolipin synthase A/B
MAGMIETTNGYWPFLIALISALIGVAAAIHAALTKDDVSAAIGWVGIILLSPLIGAALYAIAGINRIRRRSIGNRRIRMEDRVSGMRGTASAFPADTERRFQSLYRLGDNVSPFPLANGNRIEPLAGGDAAYSAMLEAIAQAKRHVALSTYIFDNDPAGREFVAALSAARRRGVEVRVLVDAVGARYSRPSIGSALRPEGVPIDYFLGNIIGFRLPYAQLRNHRKIMVVDGEIAFTGGMNIRAGFTTSHAGRTPDRDMHFRLQGPAAGHLLAVFADDWFFAAGERLEGPAWHSGPGDAAGTSFARVVVSGPDLSVAATHTMIMGALAVARERVAICSPYFLPDQQLVGALAVAARRGVAVDIVIPAANNLRLVDFAMTAQLDQVIAPGCRVYRAAGPFDHAKLLVVDSRWAYVGSSNIDPRSFRLNFELDLEVFDAELAQRIERHIDSRIAESAPVTMARLRAMPLVKRLRNRIVWLASPYL